MDAPAAVGERVLVGPRSDTSSVVEMRVWLSVIIPTFNEESRIETAIRAIHAHLFGTGVYETIVADDASSDRTADIVCDLGESGFPVRFLPAESHRGKGAAVRRGVMASQGDLVLMTDADLSTPIGELDRLLQQLKQGADVAIGSRGLSGSQLIVRQPAYRELSGKLFNVLVRMLLLPKIRDTQCGFKLTRGPAARALFERCTIDGFAYDVELLALAAKAGYKVVEVPVVWAHSRDSKVRFGRDGFGMLVELFRIVYRLRAGRYLRSTERALARDSDTLVAP